MNKVYTTKGDLIKDIIWESDEPLTYKEIIRTFEEKTEDKVTIPRIRQVVQEMEEAGKAEVERRINEKGNAVSYVKSRREENNL